MKYCSILILIFIIALGQSVQAKEFEQQMYTYQLMKKNLLSIAKAYDLEVRRFGQSEFGRDLLAVKIGHGENTVFITGSHHGREWLSTHIVMEMIKQYAEAYKNSRPFSGHSPEILDDVAIWFIPMVNPDGVTIQQKGISSFPYLLQEVYIDMNEGDADFTRWKANGLGVDLNRQYPAGWDNIEGDTADASYSHFKGKKPLESKETKALTHFTKQIKPLTTAAYHTSGRELYWYYFNSFHHLQRDYSLTEKISKKTGYEISYPPFDAIGGGYTDWFIQEYERPAVTIELSYLIEDTNPPLSVFDEEWKRNKEIGFILCEYAKKELLVEK
ncbi:M14 family metallopeptidase [Metabacillus halosaccharovorans]|uniref:M14 family metallopeptidase n=1 Tax=Metabacillus halosaccharovorans TaxID=930124 RepID=UPI000994919B|nr:M14 family metallocarboxypeptidase [Metabacillus halosaccharovorans]